MNIILRLACVSGFAAVPLAWGLPVYSITPLGVFRGSAATPTAINSQGQVAGYGIDTAGITRAFVTGGSSYTELGIAAAQAQATGINDSGTVVGTTYGANGPQAALWKAGDSTGAVVIVPGASSSYANAVSQDGTVVGGFTGMNGQLQAFAYKDGALTSLGNLPGSNWTCAYAVNSNGEVVGYALDANGSSKAFSWSSNSGFTTLESGSGSSTFATGINDSGMVVGDEVTAEGYIQAVAWASGTKTALGTLGSGVSFAYGVNNSGDAVGSAYPNGATGLSAVLFRGGTAVDLNTLVPFDSGWVLEQALAINNAGQITGTGKLNGENAAFLLTLIADDVLTPSQSGLAGQSPLVTPQPQMAAMMMISDTPEPGTLALTGAVLLGLGCLRRRRRAHK
jgi:probable HAF family extracellular repeat protein